MTKEQSVSTIIVTKETGGKGGSPEWEGTHTAGLQESVEGKDKSLSSCLKLDPDLAFTISTSCVTLGKLPKLSGPQFSQLENGDHSTYAMWLREVNKLIFLKSRDRHIVLVLPVLALAIIEKHWKSINGFKVKHL